MDWETLLKSLLPLLSAFHKGLFVKNGSSQRTEQALCRAVARVSAFATPRRTGIEDAEPAIFDIAIRALAEGNRRSARIVQIDKDTACDWLDRAASSRGASCCICGAICR